MVDALRGKVFWTGGSQAVRLPKAMRLAAREVVVRRRGTALVIEPVSTRDDWDGFWDDLAPLAKPVRRPSQGVATKRRPI